MTSGLSVIACVMLVIPPLLTWRTGRRVLLFRQLRRQEGFEKWWQDAFCSLPQEVQVQQWEHCEGEYWRVDPQELARITMQLLNARETDLDGIDSDFVLEDRSTIYSSGAASQRTSFLSLGSKWGRSSGDGGRSGKYDTKSSRLGSADGSDGTSAKKATITSTIVGGAPDLSTLHQSSSSLTSAAAIFQVRCRPAPPGTA